MMKPKLSGFISRSLGANHSLVSAWFYHDPTLVLDTVFSQYELLVLPVNVMYILSLFLLLRYAVSQRLFDEDDPPETTLCADSTTAAQAAAAQAAAVGAWLRRHPYAGVHQRKGLPPAHTGQNAKP